MWQRLQENYLRVVQSLLPSPFTIAVLLTAFTYLLALLFTQPAEPPDFYAFTLLQYWQTGFWELLGFTMQMALILILGHTLALTPLVNRAIESITRYCTSTARAALLVSFFSIFVSFINWGLCLVFGAILARKVAEKALKEGLKLNYPLIGAAGYCGMMVWHGGFSGSAPLKVAEEHHFLAGKIGQINITDTLFSSMNLTTGVLLLVLVPLTFYLIGRNTGSQPIVLKEPGGRIQVKDQVNAAEKLDYYRITGWLLGGIMLFTALYKAFREIPAQGLNFITLDYINFILFGSCLILHQSFRNFLHAIQDAIGDASGILIQFPLYAGIMGIMKYSGLVTILSSLFVQISTPATFPAFAFASAAIVNIFVPSGGGQWAVQGPILCDAALALNVPVSKTVMALAYGDEVTNMLQPFWALPLLGITQLRAKDILPYSSLIMVLGGLIFITCLSLF